jgi:nitroreductase
MKGKRTALIGAALILSGTGSNGHPRETSAFTSSLTSHASRRLSSRGTPDEDATRHSHSPVRLWTGAPSASNNLLNNDEDNTELTTSTTFESVIKQRYACTRYEKTAANETADAESQQRIKDASEILDLSRRAPTGFNVQPYRAILVTSPEAKAKLATYCLGRNADRVRDSDCTAVFLADRECGRDLGRLGESIRERDAELMAAQQQNKTNTNDRSPMSNFALRKIQVLVLLFSSGYPIPRFLAAPISFFVRLGVATVSAITRRKVLVPSLGSAETWSTKNTMLFAMSYILGCTSRGLATCPMEGFNAGGVRKALNIPRRFAIPLIVSTGVPYKAEVDESDDVGMSHGPKGGVATDRFPVNKVLFTDSFGQDWA